MGLCNSPDIFQEKINELFQGFEEVRAYIDDILLITKSDWNDHLQKLEKIFQKLAHAGLKVNAEKSFFGRHECEYLGFWITRKGIRPLSKKVEAIKNIAPPKTTKGIRSFVGLINYYRDMWPRRAHTMSPLTKLTSSKTKFIWKDEHQKAFDAMKKQVGRDVLLAYPDFNEKFIIHADASKTQLGGIISQKGKPIAFYSRKLTDAQTRYTTTERELLSIVETLKEFRTILLGQQIEIYTDHKNLTCTKFNTDRVIRWRLLLEEYGPSIYYLKGKDNEAADAMSRLEIFTLEKFNTNKNAEIKSNPAKHMCKLGIDDLHMGENDITKEILSESYGLDELEPDTFPLTYEYIDKYQRKDSALMGKLKSSLLNNANNNRLTGYYSKSFRGGGKEIELICYNGKIVIPKILQNYVLNWYHTYLLHPGSTRTEETIKQHFYWQNLQSDVKKYVGTCETCQKCKKQKSKYGWLPAKEAEAVPWERLCVDLIGPYTIERKNQENLTLKAVTMIDPATGWLEIEQYLEDREAITIANIVENTWLTRYPRPDLCTIDRGSEFIGHQFKNQLMKKEYGIKVKKATTANPQANSILERVHQVIGNMIRTFQLEENYLDEDDPWKGILAATAFAIRSTYHTTLQATPGQLVFGRDLILNCEHIADWEAIKQRKQKLINKNNENENKKRIPHKYAIGDKILIRNRQARKMELPYKGPYEITYVFTNGTVRVRLGTIEDRVNIRHIVPYEERT